MASDPRRNPDLDAAFGEPTYSPPQSGSARHNPDLDAAVGATAEATTRRLIVALDLLRRQVQAGNGSAASFANRDRATAGAGHPAASAMAAVAAVAAAAASRGPAGSPDGRATRPGPTPVTVVGWRAGLIPGDAATLSAVGGPKALPEKIEDAEIIRVVSQPPKELPAPAAGAMWKPPHPPPGEGKPKKPAEEPKGPKEPRTPKGGGGDSVGKALFGVFARVIGPLTAISTVLGQANSGMSAFSKAVNILGATLAPLLLPAIVLLSAGLLSVSDIIWSKLRPNLAAFTSFVLDTLVPAAERLVESYADLVDAIQWVVEVAKDPSKLVRGTDAERAKGEPPGSQGADHMMNVADWILRETPVIGDISKLVFGRNAIRDGANVAARAGTRVGQAIGTVPTDGQIRRAGDAELQATPHPPGAGAPPATAGSQLRQNVADRRQEREQQQQPARPGQPGGRPSVRDNIRKVAQDLAQSMGPQASFGSIAGASKNATLASLNKSPLDADLLMRNLESIQELLRGIEEGSQQQPTPRYPGQRQDGG